jgi:hypothetical protein
LHALEKQKKSELIATVIARFTNPIPDSALQL